MLGFFKSGITEEVADHLKLDKSKNYSLDEIVKVFKTCDLKEVRALKKDFHIFCNYYDVDILKGL